MDTNQKIMIFGCNGALGSELCRQLEVNGYPLKKIGRKDLISNFDIVELKKLIEDYDPSLVINCIAMTGIDKCAELRAEAVEVNGNFPMKLLAICQHKSIRMIHFSTDSVFQCNEDILLPLEGAIPSPITWYGVTKYLGEVAVKNSEHVTIIRLPMLYGPTNKDQLIGRLINKLRLGEAIGVSQDVYTTPTYTPDVAHWVIKNILQENNSESNVLHLTSGHRISLYDFMLLIGEAIDLNQYIKPVAASSFSQKEVKPRFGGLKSKYVKEFSFEKSLSNYIDTLIKVEG